MGVTGVDQIEHFEEFNIEQGGPIIKNKLWFFGAFRQAYYDKPIANTFQTDGSVPYPAGLPAVRRRPGIVRAGHLGREDGQPGRPPHLAGVASATSSRSTWTARCACAATRWAR